MLKRHFSLITLLAIAPVLTMTACRGISPIDLTATAMADPAESRADSESDNNPVIADLGGDIVVDGSSTVFPITTAVAEEFSAVYADVRVSVGLSGTGGGFEKFCAGETDISDASRPIKDSEKEACARNGIEWTEFLVALDGLTVMVNPSNDFVQCLNPTQLAGILGADSGITTWADIDPNWPGEEILYFIPDPDSGTRDYMIEVVEDFGGPDDLRQDENTTFNSDDNVLLDGIANNENGFGFFGYAYYASNQASVKAIALENEDGECILPENDTVQNGSYNPLARPLFIHTNNASVQEKPQVAEFVKFYFSPEGAPFVMSDVGYSLPPDGTFEANLEALDALLP